MQPDNVLTTIKILFCIVPVVLYVGMFTLLSFYKLSSKRVEEISQQLQRQRTAPPETQPADAAAAVN